MEVRERIGLRDGLVRLRKGPVRVRMAAVGDIMMSGGALTVQPTNVTAGEAITPGATVSSRWTSKA